MNARSIKGKSPEEIKSALAECLTDSFVPTLAVVFLSISQDYASVSRILGEKNISIYGATTNGEFIDEELGKESIAILLLDLNRQHYSVFLEEFRDKNYRKVTQKIAKMSLEKFENPGFLIAGSHMETDAEQMLLGFEDVLGNDVNVFGGMAGDDYNFKDTMVFTNDKSTHKGVIAVALDQDKITMKGRATCGWKAVGTARTVTRSEGNHVFTVDGIPVLEATARFSGIPNLTKENRNLAMEIATNFPLQLQREKGAPIMRPGLLINWEDGSFVCSGTVPQGSKVKFSLPPDFDVIDKVIQEAENLKAVEMPEADAMIVYNCAGRLIAFGPLITKEIEGLKKVWDVPMAGFFTNAELARATDGNLEMHNLTTCCVLIKEK